MVYSLSAQTSLHEVGHDGRVVPDEGVLGVRGFVTNLLVRVAERTTDRLRETNLVTGFKEVLALEHIFGGELTEILGGGNLTGQKR